MSDDVLVRVEKLSKKYCRRLRRSLWYGVKDIAGELMGRNGSNSKLRKEEFWALKDISFDIKRGEIFGLIGRNGAGKSTLLKLLNGLMKPDLGRVTVMGITGSLIELNTGINPILTGRENIFVNAAVLGISKSQVNKVMNDIIDFSELDEFIDTPVQYYSSGMRVRLGFSLATSILKPDFLILDEVLAVGDAHFRSKCYNHIGKLTKDTAVIFVSHHMDYVARLCDRCLLLDKGKAIHIGNVPEGIEKYMTSNQDETNTDGDSFLTVDHPIKSVKFKWSQLILEYGQSIDLTVTIETNEAMRNVRFQIPLYDNQSFVVAEMMSQRAEGSIDLVNGINVLKFRLGPIYLKNGKYDLAFVMGDVKGIGHAIWSFKQYSLRIDGPAVGAYAYQIPSTILYESID